MENKKEYVKPEIKDEDIILEDIIMASTDNQKSNAFKPDAGIWDIFRW